MLRQAGVMFVLTTVYGSAWLYFGFETVVVGMLLALVFFAVDSRLKED